MGRDKMGRETKADASRETLDLFAFTAAAGAGREGGQLTGTRDLLRFSRLIDGLPPQSTTQINWSLYGECTSGGRRYIEVRAQGQIVLECQRCLQPFVVPLQVVNRLEIVRSPAELDDDDEIERIVGSPRFDVLEFIEDELILSLPPVPKHEVCPSAPGGSDSAEQPDAEAGRPSPFAVLEKLKKERN
ncbi:MAG TPA: YceD family protein [Pusillimonas sp.]|uniref:YceD family protein n=1 Tax=unclassified Pusillimonas TaxID=2640016 RepID=UPI0026385D93|nr:MULTISPECIES: YceD family protein [unclassified Pusillimonas]HLU20735.1 YceD family protein [Pusillimonas sp.]